MALSFETPKLMLFSGYHNVEPFTGTAKCSFDKEGMEVASKDGHSSVHLRMHSELSRR